MPAVQNVEHAVGEDQFLSARTAQPLEKRRFAKNLLLRFHEFGHGAAGCGASVIIALRTAASTSPAPRSRSECARFFPTATGSSPLRSPRSTVEPFREATSPCKCTVSLCATARAAMGT